MHSDPDDAHKGRNKRAEMTKGIDRVCAQGALVTTGNFDGEISSVAEKALGGMYKSGTAPVSGVVGYAEKPSGRRLYLMDSPGVDHKVVRGAWGPISGK